MKNGIIFAALLATSAFGCKKDDKKDEPTATRAEATSSPEKPATETEKAPPVKAKTCADYGATGEGTFEKNCELTGAGPFDIVATDEFIDDYGQKRRGVKVTNKANRDVDLLTYQVYYYDKDGKSAGKPAMTSGNGGKVVGAGKTVTHPLGRQKTDEPAGASKIEAEILFWTVGEGKAQLFFKSYSKKLNSELDDRPMGGWPSK